jgi:hypothetical protein
MKRLALLVVTSLPHGGKGLGKWQEGGTKGESERVQRGLFVF